MLNAIKSVLTPLGDTLFSKNNLWTVNWIEIFYTLILLLIVFISIRTGILLRKKGRLYLVREKEKRFLSMEFFREMKWIKYIFLPTVIILVSEIVCNNVSSIDSGWNEIHYRLKVIAFLCVMGSLFLIIITNPKLLWDDVKAEINFRKDLFLSVSIVAVINILQARINYKGFNYHFTLFGMESLIVYTTILAIFVFEYVKMEGELKNVAGFWSSVEIKLNSIGQNMIGIQTTKLNRMFEPTGLKYFITTAETFAKKKNDNTQKNNPIDFYRIFVLRDTKHNKICDTWVKNAKCKTNLLTKKEQLLQVYDLLHSKYGVKLHIITQLRLFEILQEIKNEINSKDVKTNEDENCLTVIRQISPSNCKKMVLDLLDCLIINGTPYITAPSYYNGLSFEPNESMSNLISLLCQKIIGQDEFLYAKL